MNYRMVKDRVLVRLDATDTATTTGLIIPEVAQKRACTGLVVSVGPDVECLEIGQRVAFSDKAHGGHIGTDLWEIDDPSGTHYSLVMCDIDAVIDDAS